jgi:FkbM family methyltransferase
MKDVKPIELSRTLRIIQSFEFPHKLGICDRIFGRSLSKRGICWVKSSTGIIWKLDLTSSSDRWIVYGKYEGAAFLDWAKSFLPKNGIVVDSGANIGQMLLYLAQYVPEGKVLAFEPGPAPGAWLQECLELNQDLPVELIKAGLGLKHGAAKLMEQGAVSIHGGQNCISESTGIPIVLTSLSHEIAVREIDRVDLWKLDVEGYEIEALKGALPLLESKRIRALYVEMFEANGLRILEFLTNVGYACYSVEGKNRLRPMTKPPAFVNGLFLPRN